MLFKREREEKRIFFWHTVLSLLLITAMAAMAEFLLPRNLELVSLHYSIYTGIDRIGPWAEVFLHPAVGLLFFLLNSFFAYRFAKRQEGLLAQSLLAANIGILILLTIATWNVVNLNQ